MMNEKRILAATDSTRNGSVDGGQRRTRQIQELVSKAGYEMEFSPSSEPISDLRKYVLGLKYFIQTGSRASVNWRLLRRHGAVIARYQKVLQGWKGKKVLVWEKTLPIDLVLPYLARQHGYSILAAPHNLEAIANQHDLRSSMHQALRREVSAVSVANAVFTISEQEQWLLGLFGVPATFLPYYPPLSIREFLNTVRQARTQSEKQYWLLLGTAANVPTYLGICEVLDWAKQFPCGDNLPLHIAGFETERLKPQVAGTNYVIHGSVSQEELMRLLAGAKAVLVHQRAGAGALTRIPEMLMAGIPVLANRMAARSNSAPGVYIYDTAEQLHALMQTPQLPAPPAPVPPPAEQQFIQSLQRLAQAE